MRQSATLYLMTIAAAVASAMIARTARRQGSRRTLKPHAAISNSGRAKASSVYVNSGRGHPTAVAKAPTRWNVRYLLACALIATDDRRSGAKRQSQAAVTSRLSAREVTM
jgi:hypothetical protein